MEPFPDLPFSAAAERNKLPILQVLHEALGDRADVLELASGTGQHAEYIAAQRPQWRWQPSDADRHLCAAIAQALCGAGQREAAAAPGSAGTADGCPDSAP